MFFGGRIAWKLHCNEEMKITKKQFVSCMEAIKQQRDKDSANAKLLGQVYDAFEANLMYDNHVVVNSLLGLLEALTGDENKTIDYFIYELEWGTQGHKLAITDTVRGKTWNLQSIEDLYKYLKFYY
jgi:hypothetical protein